MFQIRSRLLPPQQQTTSPPAESGIAHPSARSRTRAQQQRAEARENAEKPRMRADHLEEPSREGTSPRMNIRSLWSRATSFFRPTTTVGTLVNEFYRLHWSKTRCARQADLLIRHRIRRAHGGVLLDTMRVVDVTRDLAREWMAAQRDSPRAANRALNMVRQAWRELLPEEPCPFGHVKAFPQRARTRCFTDDERQRFLATLAVMRGGRGGLLRVTADALFTLAVTGARTNEVLELRVDQVDVLVGIAVLDEHKTSDEDGSRVIHLGAALDLIKRRVEESRAAGSCWVFPGRFKTKHLTVVNYGFHRVCERAGIVRTRDLCVHMLRHDFASVATRTGMSPRVIQKCLGHRDPTTTARYIKVSEDLAQQLAAKVGERMGGARW